MKKRLFPVLILATILCMTLIACNGDKATDGNADSSSEATINENMHDTFGVFESITVDGKKVDQTALEGKKLTMVNIWGTFCSPCIGEMPILEKISKEYASKGVQVVGIPQDVYVLEDGSHDARLLEEAKHIIEQTGVTYLNILPCESLNKIKLDTVFSYPETIFLDEDGNRIGGSYMGARNYEQWCAVIDSLLAGPEEAETTAAK